MRKKYNKDEMYRLILAWEASGISQAKFLHQRGIAKSTFGYWRKKYMREKNTAKKKRSFIPVKVDVSDSKPVTTTSPDLIELIYPNGVRLTCSNQIDFSRLKTLIVL